MNKATTVNTKGHIHELYIEIHRKLPYKFIKGYTILKLYHQYVRILVSPHHHWHLLLSLPPFFKWAILLIMLWYCFVVLICIFLIANAFKLLFICLAFIYFLKLTVGSDALLLFKLGWLFPYWVLTVLYIFWLLVLFNLLSFFTNVRNFLSL